MKTKREKKPSICGARIIAPFVLKLEFSDGRISRVDFGPFLTKSKLPNILKYSDRRQFSRYALVGGNVIWGDYEMLFPVAELYIGSIRVP